MHFGTVRRPSAAQPSCHEYAEFRPRLTVRRCVRRVVASAYEKVRGRSKSKPGDTERTRGVGGVGPTYDKVRGLSKPKPGIRDRKSTRLNSSHQCASRMTAYARKK